MPNPIALPSAAVLCLALVAGCGLVDQRSFDRQAGRTPIPVLHTVAAKAPAPVPPLYVVRADAAGGDWQSGLREAARQALERKPNVLFTVESAAPLAGSPERQAAALQDTVARLGRPVAGALAADGAQPAQIELTAVSDAALQSGEVRIFVH